MQAHGGAIEINVDTVNVQLLILCSPLNETRLAQTMDSGWTKTCFAVASLDLNPSLRAARVGSIGALPCT